MAHTIKINNVTYTANNIYYCSPTGNDTTGDGTISKPFFSYLTAYNKAVDGDAICFLKGEYNYTNANVYQYIDTYGHGTFSCEKSILIFSDIRNTKINISYSCSRGRGYGFAHMKGKLINVHFKTVALSNINSSIWGYTLNSIMFNEPQVGWTLSNCIFEFSNPYTKHTLVYDNLGTATTINNCVFYVYDTMLEQNYSGNITLKNCVFNKQIVYNSFYGGSGSSATATNCTIDSSMNTTKSKLLSYTSKLPSGEVYIDNIPMTAILVSQININPNSAELIAKKQLQLTAEILPTNATNKNVTWSSSDDLIATVDFNGLITGNKKGTCIITATAQDGSGIKSTCTINVISPVSEVIKKTVANAIKSHKLIQEYAIISIKEE